MHVSPSDSSEVNTLISLWSLSRRSTTWTICRTFLFAVSLSEPTPCPIRSCAAPSAVSSLAAARTRLGHVAVKKSVCRLDPASLPPAPKACAGRPVFLHRLTMSFICGMKPMDSIASASSRTRYATSFTLTAGAAPFSLTPTMKSFARPGVDSRMSQPFSSCRSCAPFHTPPKQGTKRCPMAMDSLAVSVAICWVSSRVGASTSTRGSAGRLSVEGRARSRRRARAGSR
mmetsp:Transcript_54193/g.141187  ORF Transcript_54193/g.141187 Transcript_54193/m.141187 type:complete len:229 (-) Transcript_54193:36-722(-)